MQRIKSLYFNMMKLLDISLVESFMRGEEIHTETYHALKTGLFAIKDEIKKLKVVEEQGDIPQTSNIVGYKIARYYESGNFCDWVQEVGRNNSYVKEFHYNKTKLFTTEVEALGHVRDLNDRWKGSRHLVVPEHEHTLQERKV